MTGVNAYRPHGSGQSTGRNAVGTHAAAAPPAPRAAASRATVAFEVELFKASPFCEPKGINLGARSERIRSVF